MCRERDTKHSCWNSHQPRQATGGTASPSEDATGCRLQASIQRQLETAVQAPASIRASHGWDVTSNTLSVQLFQQPRSVSGSVTSSRAMVRVCGQDDRARVIATRSRFLPPLIDTTT